MTISDSTKPFAPNWRNILVVIPTHLVGLLAIPVYVYGFGGTLTTADWILMVAMYAFSVLGICIAYHRGLSHRAFGMNRPLRMISLLAGTSAGEGSALSWCSDHRRHHIYEDTPADPYNVNRSFWWAHIGWLLGSPTTTDFSNVKDLERDPLLRFQHKYYGILYVASSYLLPMFIGALYGRALEGLLFGGFVRLFFVNQATFMINSYAHYFGRQPYSTKSTAKDSWLLAFLASGEGWHNYHHRFPFDYRNGPKVWQWDPGKWFIYSASKMGWAWNLKRTPDIEILKAQMETAKEKKPVQSPVLQELEVKISEAYQKWNKAALEWNLKTEDFKRRRSQEWDEAKESLATTRAEYIALYRQWWAEVRATLNSQTA